MRTVFPNVRVLHRTDLVAQTLKGAAQFVYAYSPQISFVLLHPDSVRSKSIKVEPISEGFNTYLQAAFIKKGVPVIMVGDLAKADYVIVGTAETVKAGWAKTIFITPKR